MFLFYAPLYLYYTAVRFTPPYYLTALEAIAKAS